ncbi:preprotein translocase subunit SecG [Candidatus Collierbacteria bacterium CG17_big_fil_post_rev_8_21_14_2_50_45_7]|uniref:Protein-export membrane protein SecG n=1 Tax=Candidatus Collierbacteria bacterium CG17_big_fil_post_rev_8_21_14_2_50_45_7 TaxID=1974536 RepID=A0A2M7FMR8_9BACT|nr:MAG: preprotein translocase subunit SecG [Candidatus Collierbacteria bacterium CG17_big_fil_post_rev_8_21_14_2_50_45_7]
MFILIAQILVSIILIVLVILQAKGGGLSGVFGGSTNYHAKRGVEKTLFYATIVTSVLFVALAIANAI